MIRTECVKYKYDVRCEKCGRLLARRGTMSVAYDAFGEEIIASNAGASMDELVAIYELPCPNCGTVLELDCPRNVLPWTTYEPNLETGPRVLKRR